jgi:hypothetical protein
MADRSALDGPLARLAGLLVFAGAVLVIGWTARTADPPPGNLPEGAITRPAGPAGTPDAACVERRRAEIARLQAQDELSAEQVMMLRQQAAADCR